MSPLLFFTYFFLTAKDFINQIDDFVYFKVEKQRRGEKFRSTTQIKTKRYIIPFKGFKHLRTRMDSFAFDG